MAVFKSEQTAVHLVTLLEEMPVQETIDAVADLTAHGLPVGGVIVNAVRTPALAAADLAAAEKGKVDLVALRKGLKGAGLDEATGTDAGRRGDRACRPGRPGRAWARCAD